MRTEDLRRIVAALVSSYPGRAKVQNWWRKPLLATAQVDDRFTFFSKIWYLTLCHGYH
jgi:hypothetical protein